MQTPVHHFRNSVIMTNCFVIIEKLRTAKRKYISVVKNSMYFNVTIQYVEYSFITTNLKIVLNLTIKTKSFIQNFK